MFKLPHGSVYAVIVHYVSLICVDGEVKAHDAFSPHNEAATP